MVGPSSSPNGIENRDLLNVGGGDGFCVYPDHTNKDIVYSEWQRGNISRMHLSTGKIPKVSIRYMLIHPRDADLVLGTHGRGINRVSWAMRMKPPEVPRSQSVVGLAPVFGPMVPEGIYTVKLIKGKKSYSGQIKLIVDPKSPPSEMRRSQLNS